MRTILRAQAAGLVVGVVLGAGLAETWVGVLGYGLMGLVVGSVARVQHRSAPFRTWPRR